MSIQAVRILLSLLATALLSSQGWAQGQSLSADTEYRFMLNELNERYQDFFVQQKDAERAAAARERASGEIKSFRTQNQRELEAARQSYIRERRARPDDTPLRLAWEAEEKAWTQKNESSRQDYVRKRNSLRTLLQGARRIPENQEVGLDEF